MYVCMYVCMGVHVWVCMYVCMYAYMYRYLHFYIHVHNNTVFMHSDTCACKYLHVPQSPSPSSNSHHTGINDTYDGMVTGYASWTSRDKAPAFDKALSIWKGS